MRADSRDSTGYRFLSGTRYTFNVRGDSQDDPDESRLD